MKRGFDKNLYLKKQTKSIKDRMKRFEGKLYLEFGGKLYGDFHAARVLPGYNPDTKIELLKKLGKDAEIIYCVSAKDLQKGRVRHDYGLTYDNQTLKDIRELKERGLEISTVIIAIFDGEEAAKRFKRRLENLGHKVYYTYEIKGYPTDIKKVVSDKGYGKQPYIETEKPLVIITGAGGGSGKMSLCLSQLYHDRKKGLKSGYAKFETFPIWNLTLDHPINIAYEAATADLLDVNMADPFHKKVYGKTAVNYNRDIENFGIMKRLIEKIVGKKDPVMMYKSPTDMGVNMAGFAITNDGICREAAKQEIIRRYFRYKKEYVKGIEKKSTIDRMNELMKKVNVKEEDREVVVAARRAAEDARVAGKGNKGVYCGAAVQLSNGKIVAGKNSPLLHAESAATLNSIKVLAGIPDKVNLLPKNVIQNINNLKKDVLGRKSESLNLEETMIALAISSASDKNAEKSIKMLSKLKYCDMHVTHLPSPGDDAGLLKLMLNVTSDTQFAIE